MTTDQHTPGRADDVDKLLHLVDRAERGALLPAEAAKLRAGIRDMATYRGWCNEWSHVARAGRARAAMLRRALRRALARAKRTAAAEAEVRQLRAALGQVELPQHAYEQLLVAQMLHAVAFDDVARRLDQLTGGRRSTP